MHKVSSAVHLRFDIRASSLPDPLKERLLHLNDQRINNDGVVVIKAQEYRSLENNSEEALRRLQELVKGIAVLAKRRKPSKPSKSSQRKRVDSKVKRGKIKTMREKVVA